MKSLITGLVMLTFGVLPAMASDAQVQISADQSRVTVVGTGVVQVMPDMGYVHFDMNTRAKTAKEAQEKNAVATKRLVEALVAKFNLNKTKDIKTTGYSVNPEHSNTPDRPIIGYKAEHSISVRVMDIDAMGSVIDHAGTFKAEVDYVQFGLSEQTAYEHEALKLAMNHAQGRAKAIAEANGKPLGRVVKVSEAKYEVDLPRQEMEEEQADSSTEIYPDEVSVSATLTVVYEF